MQIKILCACDTKYAFDIEPVHGRMPAPVNCPTCGADGTEAANDLIRRQLEAAAPPAPSAPPPSPVQARQPVRIAGAAPVPAPAAPALELRSQPAAEGAPEAAGTDRADGGAAPVLYCPKHRREEAAAPCHVCGKPICLKCMEQFGYVCSVYCQSQADQRGIPVPVYAGRKFAVKAREWRATKLVVGAIVALAVLLLGTYIWYIFSGCKPRTRFALQTPKSDRPVQSLLVAPDEMLLLRRNKLSLLNAGNGREAWSLTLPAPTPPAAAPSATTARGPAALAPPDDDIEPLPPRFQVSGEDAWVFTGDRVLRLEWKTGRKKSEVALAGRIREVEFTEGSILAIGEDDARQKAITHVSLASGTSKTESPSLPVTGRAAGGRTAGRTAFPARPGLALPRSGDDEMEDFSPDAKEFLPAGVNVVQVQSTLLEKRMVPVQAMKEAPKQTKLNSGNLSARDSMNAVREELNEMQRERTGGVTYENESRYRVTLRRLAPSDSPEWTGEVTGPPMVFPQKTVDVLVAGKSVHVFSKKNQKLWEGKLSFPVGERFVSGYGGANAPAPCLEEGGSLYVFDKGVLTAFDSRTGTVAWRVPSVGISQVVRDGNAKLYVSTTSASPEAIQYTQEVRFEDRPQPVIMKVDAATGRVLWKAGQLGDRIYLSGKYVYVTEGRISGLDVIRAGGDGREVPVHHRIYRLDPGNGKYIWQYYQSRAPGFISVQNNRLLLQYRDEVQLLSYLTL